MANDQTKLPFFERGKKLLASQLNDIVSALVARILGGPGVNIRATNNNIVISLDPTFPLAAADIVMQVRSVHDDYLLCRILHVDGTVSPTDIKVLKPWEIRRTPFHGLTVDGVSYAYTSDIERVADGSDTYQITPNYWFGAEILVKRQANFYLLTTGDRINLVDAGSRTWALVS